MADAADPAQRLESGLAALDAGRAAQAALLASGLIAEWPHVPDALHLAGLAARENGDASLAAKWFRRACTVLSGHVVLESNLGDALRASGKLEEAEHVLRRASRSAPDFAPVHLNLALALGALERNAEAAMSARRALALRPAHQQTLVLAGTLSLPAGERVARSWFRRGAIWECRQTDVLQPLAFGFLETGSYAEARKSFRRLAALMPESPIAWRGEALIAISIGDAARAEIGCDRVLALEPENKWVANLRIYALGYQQEAGNAKLFDAYRRWERIVRSSAMTAPEPFTNSTDRARRIRVGYVSADFRSHAIAYLLEPLLAEHDPKKVEVFCYSETIAVDAMTQRMQSLSAVWRETNSMDDEACARQIRDDGIDILVFLAGHTVGNRLLIAGLKPAPIQVNLHDLSTSGLAPMDYWLTDIALHPPGATEGRTEEFAKIPSLYLHRLPDEDPAVGTPPCVASGQVVFGSLNNPAKITDAVARVWARIVNAVPGSKLCLGYQGIYSDPLVLDTVRRRFVAAGMDPQRLEFIIQGGFVGRQIHLQRLWKFDIALDPFPYTGGLTTFEALWMGVPVVALAGQRFAARGGVSHLAQVGLDDLIAENEDAYVDIACSLARDPAKLVRLRSELRPRIKSSPLADAPAYARSVEEAYRRMWHRWCDGEKPAEIVVGTA